VKDKILITGRPSVGKTTLIKRLLKAGVLDNAVGFYTEEIRRCKKREGFKIVSLDEKHSTLFAHIHINSPFRVGRYGIDIQKFERFLSCLEPSLKEASMVVIDEIGKMECFSERFIRIVKQVLEGPQTLLATVAMKGTEFIAEVKNRSDVTLFNLTIENRDEIFERLLMRLSKSQ